MGNSSKSSSNKSFGYTVRNQGMDNVKSTLKHGKEDKDNHTLYLKEVWWNYKYIGSHRFLEMKFQCNKCSYWKWVRTDKTDDGSKNIRVEDSIFKENGWQYFRKTPKKSYSFGDIVNMYYSSPSGYNLASNNCMHYAYHFWNKIK